MKKVLLTAASAALLLCSCEKEQTGHQAYPQKGAETYDLSFDFPGVVPMTKVTLASDELSAEASVSSVQVMVYGEKGLENSARFTSLTGNKMKVTKGVKTVVAVANWAGDLTKSENKAAVYATATALGDNPISGATAGQFVMSGESSVTVDGATSCTVNLERIASKFLLRKVSIELNSAFSSSDLVIDRVFVDNAVVNATLGGAKASLAPTDFENQRGGSLSGGVWAWNGSGAHVAWTAWTVPSGTTSWGQKLYAYPNPTTTDNRDASGAFTVRKTRIVVEATLKGKKTYYPYTFDSAILRNHYYEITDLKITGAGVDNPEDLPEKSETSFTISVKPWVSGGSTNVEI